ncbi:MULTISPECIES: phosphate ABC transporter substrate-binding protein PstS [Ramlibacter]|uniref:Phosphate-binding protein PstS n=1 Tax=Ramlibacter pinisoli TaxID=2682844 RepID=A0A6N8IYN5_9BURK|nr:MULTISPECIES: phosphate ABC transporter substrate-binding protein PstS [Ramlibacter]MBA2962197.1 phosphate ABC transporter substrate-binding protein PstS [Ramlibacter sp. CGMCC 1.13660]MVQ32139.1 phosphate ABC transporter substrate-binding protein PstS [Ramlibacter pinisoli]
MRIACVLAALAFPVLAHAQSAPAIRGAGATFPAEVYAAWGSGYARDKKVPLQYQAVGSGEGVKRITSRQVDFGASDEPMAAAELQKNNLLQFPTLVGGLVPVYNLRGVKPGELRLNGAVLAKIFAGRIKAWNDPELAALNRGLALPARPIHRVVREEASGSTRTLVRYLARHDASWEPRIALKVDWAGEAQAVRGTKGMAEAVKATEGAIGYVSYQEVVRQSLSAAQLQNRSGAFVLAGERSIQAAVAASDLSRGDETANLVDVAGPEAWPLTETTFVLLPKTVTDPAQAKRTLNFFYWVFAQGDQMASDTGFVALPTRIQARLLSRFREITGPDGRPIEFLGAQPWATEYAFNWFSSRPAATRSRPAGA